MDNWVSGSLFTANLWREPSFQENLINEMRAVEASAVLHTPIFDDFLTETIYPIYEIDDLVDIHSDLSRNIQAYAQNIKSLDELSPTSIKDTYQAQRQLLLRILPAILYTEESSFPDVVTGNRQAISSNGDIYKYTPDILHSLSNAELGALIQIGLSQNNQVVYNEMLSWYESDEFMPQGNLRDIIGVPIVSQSPKVTGERPFLFDVALFVGSMFYEPIDWAISGVETTGYILNGNLGGAFHSLANAIVPGAMLRVFGNANSSRNLMLQVGQIVEEGNTITNGERRWNNLIRNLDEASLDRLLDDEFSERVDAILREIDPVMGRYNSNSTVARIHPEISGMVYGISNNRELHGAATAYEYRVTGKPNPGLSVYVNGVEFDHATVNLVVKEELS